jgi:hypothetical protein
LAKITELHDGAHVSWNTSQGRTTGQILRKAVCRLYIHNYKVNASPDDPRFIVRSDKTGALAAHRASALRLMKEAH